MIQSKADELGRSITIEQRLCEGAFAVLMSGDRDKHDAMIIEQATDLAKNVDLIVLAQASMSRMAVILQEKTGLTVLSSPRLGVDYLADRVAQLGLSLPNRPISANHPTWRDGPEGRNCRGAPREPPQLQIPDPVSPGQAAAQAVDTILRNVYAVPIGDGPLCLPRSKFPVDKGVLMKTIVLDDDPTGTQSATV